MRYRHQGACTLVFCLLLGACGGSSGGSPGVSDGSWQGAMLAEDDETSGATNVRFAVGAGGHAVVSWSSFHGTGLTDVLVNHYDPVAGWQGVVAPSRDIASVTYPSMQLAIDGAGNALGLWGERQSLPGSPSTFFATTYDAGTGIWNAAVPMENDNTGKADRADVAAGPGGSFWVVFGLNMGTSMQIHANHYVPGSGWSGPTLLDSADWDPGDTFLSSVYVAADAAGNAVAAWSRYTDTDSSGTIDRTQDKESAFARRYDATTKSWAARQTLNTTEVGSAFVNDVVADPTGGFLVLWGQYDAAYDVRGWAQFYRGGALQPATSLWDHADDYFPRGAQFDGAGNALVVAGSDAVVTAFRYEAGDGWQPPEVLQGDPLADLYLEDFAVSASGDAFVLWREDVAGTYDAFVRRFDSASGTWGSVVNVDAPDSGDVRNGAKIVASPAGDAMAAWHADDGLAFSLVAARFRRGLGWGAATDIDSGPLDTVNISVGLGVDGSGAVLAAWAQGASDDEDVWFNLFD